MYDHIIAVWKKFAPILVLVLFKSVCAQANNDTGNKQSSGGNSGQPINVNVYTNKECNVKKKPSAHIEGPIAKLFKYDPSSDIKTWTATAPNAHVTGGMTYRDGKLTIPTTGFYYVYAQAYFKEPNGTNKYKRIFVLRNGQAILLTQPARFNSVTGTGYTGGVFNLQAGDVISVRVMASNTGIHMDPAHTFFGAFMISA
ncbi:hypothetical protein ACROYT_G039471 [Oculina patagonica]